MIKYLDACDKLSVQVHPSEEDVVDEAKTEAWVVLDAGENARIVRGLAPGCDHADLAKAVADSADDPTAIEKVLNAFRPGVGEAILVPAGTVHSIGPDVVVFEVQQNSDVTYRLYDWGRPRELHFEQALLSYRDDVDGDGDVLEPKPCDGGQFLIDHPLFTVRRLNVDQPQGLDTEGSFKVLNVIEGQGTVGWRSGGDDPPLFAQRGDTVLVPAAIEQVFLSPVGRFEIFWTGPGEESR